MLPMSYQLNEKIRGLDPYDPISGDYKIRLDANESFLDTASLLGEQLCQAVSRAALNRYPDPYAVRLVQMFSDYYHLDPQTVCAGNGSDELIGILVAAFYGKRGQVAHHCAGLFPCTVFLCLDL